MLKVPARVARERPRGMGRGAVLPDRGEHDGAISPQRLRGELERLARAARAAHARARPYSGCGMGLSVAELGLIW